MSEQNCVLACGLGQGRLRAAIGRSFTTVRLAVPEISCSLPLREISTAARFTPCLLPPQAADVCRNVIYINFVLRHPMYRLAAALRCPKFLARCRFAKFRPLHVSRLAFFRHRRRQGVKPLSNQNKKALLRSAFLFWQPNRDSNPNIQSQSLLCYRYTIRLYLLLAENSISVCSPVVNSFLQFSKNYV